MPEVSFNSPEDTYSDADIRRIFRSDSESDKKKVRRYLREQYGKRLKYDGKSFKNLRQGDRIVDDAFQTFEQQLVEGTIQLGKNRPLSADFDRLFDRRLLEQRTQWNDRDRKNFRAFLYQRFVNKNEAKKLRLDNSRKNLLDVCFDQFYGIINNQSFELQGNKRLEDVYQDELEGMVIDIWQAPGTSDRLSGRILFYLGEEYKSFFVVRRRLYLVQKFIESYGNRTTFNDAQHVYNVSLAAMIFQVQSGKFKRDSKLSTYFVNIFKNKCADFFNSYPTKKEGEEEWIDQDVLYYVPSDEIDRIGDRYFGGQTDKTMNEDLYESFDLLSDDCKAAIRMYFFENRSKQDAAKYMQLTEYRFARKLSECLEQIRKLFLGS